MKFEYPAKIIKDKSQRYFISFLDFDEAISEGETLEEALYNAGEVLTLTIEGRMDDKDTIPIPSDTKSKKNIHWIAPAARVQSALLFKFSKEDKSISEIARMLKTSWPAAIRLENPHHTPSLRQLEKTAHALGKKLVISFKDLQ